MRQYIFALNAAVHHGTRVLRLMPDGTRGSRLHLCPIQGVMEQVAPAGPSRLPGMPAQLLSPWLPGLHACRLSHAPDFRAVSWLMPLLHEANGSCRLTARLLAARVTQVLPDLSCPEMERHSVHDSADRLVQKPGDARVRDRASGQGADTALCQSACFSHPAQSICTLQPYLSIPTSPRSHPSAAFREQ